MNDQKRDLVSSRNKLEASGEQFGCFICGQLLPPVSSGHVSDACDKCEEALSNGR